MSAKVFSAAVLGVDCVPVEVEADITATQLGNFIIVGLPDAAVQESRERIRSAMKNSGVPFPTKRVAVNLAPADIKKQGPAYDLPIALAIYIASLKQPELKLNTAKSLFVGELALNGKVRAVNGVLPVVLAAKQHGFEAVFVPAANAPEASVVGVPVYPIDTLAQAIEVLNGTRQIELQQPISTHPTQIYSGIDLAHVRGQEQVKRALEIAAAGGHNLLMSGPPGSGKTMLAKALAGILPPLTREESLEVTVVYSVAGQLPIGTPIVLDRPFRSPHHTASGVSLVGGGALPKPGEISLAHHGVLFLDEFPEFPRGVLEYLRQPLEAGVITVSRAAGSYHFPANFMLIAAMNPCPCGFATDPDRQCTCSAAQVASYQRKISGPLLDRIDLHVEVPRLAYDKLTAAGTAEQSASVRQRVLHARSQQQTNLEQVHCRINAEIPAQCIKQICPLEAPAEQLMKKAVDRYGLSARSYHRLLRVARTIADLAGERKIAPAHVAEALQYRIGSE